MEKTVLCLVNGLGVEHKDSCDIYSKKIMPTFDKSIQYELFTTLATSAYNYETGYQIFNTGNTNVLSVGYLDKIFNMETWHENPKFQEMIDFFSKEETTKIHIFCSLYSKTTFDHLKSFILSLKQNKKIIVHLMLNDQSMDGYKLAIKFIERLRYERIPNAELGIVFGRDLLTNPTRNFDFNDFCNLFIKGIGEQWNDPEKKFAIYEQQNTAPVKAKAIYVSQNYRLESNNSILFFNYDKEDFSKMYGVITNKISISSQPVVFEGLNFYSMFPLFNIEGINHYYDDLVSETSLAKGLDQLNTKALVLLEQKELNSVCFMNNGLSQVNSPNITYMPTDSGVLYNNEQMQAIINNEQFPLIIINYSIDQYNDAASLKEGMTKIDTSLANIKETCKGKYRLIFSSLYGIEKEITLENGSKGKVNFRGNVPCVMIDNRINQSKFKLQTGCNTGALLNTCFKSLKPDLKISSLLVSKSLLTKILYK